MTDHDAHMHIVHVRPKLPEALEPLESLSCNIFWTWHKPCRDLFKEVDASLWESLGRNPSKLLGRVSQQRLNELAQDEGFVSRMRQAYGDQQEYLSQESRFHRDLPEFGEGSIAYFSAEFGFTPCLPFYSGGLGVLAGDHLKSASDLGVPLVGVGLAYHEGYFNQYLSSDGWQQESYKQHDFLNLPMTLEHDSEGNPLQVVIPLSERELTLQVWRVDVGKIPLYLLDANVPLNPEADRMVTRHLYGGDNEMRIRQELVLGVGGLRALDALGKRPRVCHMNEGHAAFLGLERSRQIMEETGLSYDQARRITAASSLFTTHTPVPAGFDFFGRDLIERYLEPIVPEGLSLDRLMDMGHAPGEAPEAPFNMALFASRHATYCNGVSKLHGEVSRQMMASWWPGYRVEEIPVGHVTNGVHMRSWIAPEIQDLLKKYVGSEWTYDPAESNHWAQVDNIPNDELWQAHLNCKRRLVEFSRQRLVQQAQHRSAPPEELAAAQQALNPDVLTVGFARRFATYKRAALILRDMDRLKQIILNADRPVQFLFAGKAHPADSMGKELIKQLIHFSHDPAVQGRVVFLENYDIHVAQHLVQGVDIWLNTPRRPLEASGTSGMKAAANGVLNLSVLDGWWAEGFDPQVGWTIGSGEHYDNQDYQDAVEASELYDLLEREAAPLFYEIQDGLPGAWIGRMKATLKKLCSQFNTNRMVQDYSKKYYGPAAARSKHLCGDNLERLRESAAWIGRITERWEEVAVVDVSQDAPTDLDVGSRIPVRVRLTLGSVSVDDVQVEVYHGPASAEQQILRGSLTRLEYTGQDQGVHEYAGEVVCTDSGVYGYQARVRPMHPDVLIPHELGLITWFSRD